MADYDRLTSLDASFLHIERLEYPMHVGAMSILEGGPFFDAAGRFRIEDVRDLVLSRMPFMPRFRRRLMHVPYEQGRPIWVDDERFDISYHVRLTALPKPGSWEQLVALTTRVQEHLLDRERPLWELWFVEGLEGGHVAIIQKTHHSLIDGVSGVDVATLLLDMTPDFTHPVVPEWTPEPAPSSQQLLVDTIRERLTEPAEILRSIRAMVRGPLRAWHRFHEVVNSMSTMVTRDAIAPRTSLNHRTGRHRRLSVVRVPLAEVKEIRAGLGGTVNDVVLAGVAAGLRRLLQHRAENTEDTQLRVLCPVSVRTNDESGTLGNKVSAMFVTLPIDGRPAVERLATISAQTADLKERQQAMGAEMLIGATQYIAPTLMSLAARVVHRQPFFNLIVTNVPGPQVPLYMMGARLLEAFPIVPLTFNLTVVVGILSYDGTLHFGLWADRDQFIDLEVLAGGIDDGFSELLKLARERGIVTELWERDAWELADDVRAGNVKSAELVDTFIARVDKFDPELNAFCYRDDDTARARAAEIDDAVARGEDPGPWAGVPMGVKELAAVKDWPDTHASRVFEHDIAAKDCTETERLRAAGAIFVGLTTAPEFGAVNWTRSYLHGTTRNPWNPERTPGGSSGGSAAAVAAGMMPICTGSDGGGSIRIPSSYSGLFGFKVSFGRVGTNGAYDNGLTSVPGPMCRSVRDAARYIDAIAGPTAIDPTSLPKPARSYEQAIVSGDAMSALKGKKVAWSSTLGFAVTDPETEKVTHEAALALIADAGLELVDVDVQLPRPGRAWAIISNLSGATHYGERIYAGSLDDLTPVVRPGYESLPDTKIDSVLTAMRRRDQLLAAIAAVFDEVDVLLTPTVAIPAFVAEGPPPMEIAGQSVGGMGSVPFTAPFNISGMPAVSIPAGLSTDGLPIGLQAVTRRHDEELVLACGALAEANRPWPKFAPLAYG